MIGIIGGNGVAATNKLNCLIEEKLTRLGAYRDSHHPEIIIWQATQAPSRSMYLEGRGPSWIEDYIAYTVKKGSVDGISHENIVSVDGKDMTIECEIITALHMAETQS